MEPHAETGANDPFSTETLQRALGRQLTRADRTFLSVLETAYKGYCRTGAVNMWELYGLGYPGFYSGHVGNAALFPVKPRSKAEFWAWIARAIIKEQGRIPEVL